MRPALALSLLVLGCGGRPAGSLDLGPGAERPSPAGDTRPPAVDRARPDGPPASCARLRPAAKVSLEHGDSMKLAPQIVADAAGFALVWHSQLAIISSLNGELRFARVSPAGTPSATAGVVLGSDDGSMRADLSAGLISYTVVHRAVSAEPGVELRGVDGAGKTLSVAHVAGGYLHAAIAPHPQGHALLLSGKGNPQLVHVPQGPTPPIPAKPIPTAQIISSLWLAERPKGLVAALYTTNKNATLFVVAPSLDIVSQGNVGHGALIASPSFAVRDEGFAALYGNGAVLESEVYDPAGKALGHHALASLPSALQGLRETALVWTGSGLVAVYPGAAANAFRAHVLDASGKPLGEPTEVPLCLATARDVSAAWNQGTLAVASVNEASGVMASSICVSLLVCE